MTKGKSLFEKEMELEQHLMKNLLIRGNGSKPIQIVKGLMGTNSLYGLLSASLIGRRAVKALFYSVSRKGFRSYFQGTSSAARGLVKCRDLQLSPSFASSSSHSGLPLSDILQLLLPFLCIGCGIFLASLPELNQIPVPELISNPIFYPLWYRCRRI